MTRLMNRTDQTVLLMLAGAAAGIGAARLMQERALARQLKESERAWVENSIKGLRQQVDKLRVP